MMIAIWQNYFFWGQCCFKYFHLFYEFYMSVFTLCEAGELGVYCEAEEELTTSLSMGQSWLQFYVEI